MARNFRISELGVAALCVVLSCGGAGCKRKPVKVTPEHAGPAPVFTPAPDGNLKDAPASVPATPTGPTLPKVKVSTAPPPAELWKQFSGERAFAAVKKQVEFGPRPAGSAAIEAARKHIEETLLSHGWEVERQEFTDETPRGRVKFMNVIARFAADGRRPVPRQTQAAVVCSHYDTKRYSTIQFVGANDAGSSTGALLELARVLALDPPLAAKVELVFFDGEEAVVQFSELDGLYGSRYYARKLREDRRAAQFRFGILWDMIGDAELTVTLSPDSPPDLTRELLTSANALGHGSHFDFHDRDIWDDHVPLNRIRIPTVNIIDFDYLYWHTADDKLERLSPASLQRIGAVTVHLLQSKLRN